MNALFNRNKNQNEISEKPIRENTRLSNKALQELRDKLIEITPSVTGIFKDLQTLDALRPVLLKKDNDFFSDRDGNKLTSQEVLDRNFKIFEETINILLVRQFDNIVNILSVLYDTPVDEIKKYKTGEVVDMVCETISDEMLCRFFPQSRRLAQRMLLDI